jgi:hypothetical protein
MEKEDTISVQWAQEDVETSYNLLNNNNNNILRFMADTYTAGENRRILVVKVGGKSSYRCLLYVPPNLTFKIWAYPQTVLLMQQMFSQRVITD